MLKVIDYQKKYHGVTVLSIAELHLPMGIYWLKGANGSGKSTLLKSLAGILHFQGNVFLQEHISLKGKALNYRRQVNFAPADPIYPDFLNGMEMISMFVAAKGGQTNQVEKYVAEMNMGSYINHELGSYSSGMLKKLSLVLAFLGSPLLILLDEPLITIDRESLKVLYRWIMEKNKEENCGFIIASHQELSSTDLEIASELLVEDQLIKLL
jgi:ABC-2 type transport system ATP-binding protein